jgi:hypothetical protein
MLGVPKVDFYTLIAYTALEGTYLGPVMGVTRTRSLVPKINFLHFGKSIPQVVL